MDKLKLVKITVFILTFMLIFGTLCILGLFFKKTHNSASDIPTQISLKQPLGSYIKELHIDNNKLYILTVGGGQEDRVIIYDIQKNQPITTIKTN